MQREEEEIRQRCFRRAYHCGWNMMTYWLGVRGGTLTSEVMAATLKESQELVVLVLVYSPQSAQTWPGAHWVAR
jgi:hypothetical protein